MLFHLKQFLALSLIKHFLKDVCMFAMQLQLQISYCFFSDVCNIKNSYALTQINNNNFGNSKVVLSELNEVLFTFEIWVRKKHKIRAVKNAKM